MVTIEIIIYESFLDRSVRSCYLFDIFSVMSDVLRYALFTRNTQIATRNTQPTTRNSEPLNLGFRKEDP
jgi:hypothetical protein